jgi:hypothetical protein
MEANITTMMKFGWSALLIFAVIRPTVGNSLYTYSNSVQQSITDTGVLMIANIIDKNNPDPLRHTIADFAARNGMDPIDLDKRVAATGVIRCGEKKSLASANLVMPKGMENRRSEIVIAAFLYNVDCTGRVDPLRCVFHPKSGYDKRFPESGIDERYPTWGFDVYGGIHAESVIRNDDQCPARNRSDGFLVLRLKQAPDIEPYQVEDPKELGDLKFGEVVTFVGAQSADFSIVNQKTNKRVFPKHIGMCEAKDTFHAPLDFFNSSCSVGYGSSGGAVLLDVAGSRVLTGILSAADEKETSEEQYQNGMTTSQPINIPYDPINGRAVNLQITEEVFKDIYTAAMK